MHARQVSLRLSIALAALIFFATACEERASLKLQQRSLQVNTSYQVETPCIEEGANLIALSDTSVQMSGCAVVLGNVILMGDSTLSLDGKAKVSSRVLARSQDSIQVSNRCREGYYGEFVADDLTHREAELLEFARQLSNTPRSRVVDKLEGEITGNGSLNVIEVRHEIRLAAKQSIVLRGGKSDQFVIVVKEGGIILSGDSSIRLAGDVSPSQVVFLVEGPNAMLVTGNAQATGAFLAPQSSFMLAGNGKIRGSVVAQGSIMVSGNGQSLGPSNFCPQIELPATGSPPPPPSPTPSPTPSPSPPNTGEGPSGDLPE